MVDMFNCDGCPPALAEPLAVVVLFEEPFGTVDDMDELVGYKKILPLTGQQGDTGEDRRSLGYGKSEDEDEKDVARDEQRRLAPETSSQRV